MKHHLYPLLASLALQAPSFCASEMDTKVGVLSDSVTSFATSLYSTINTSDSDNLVFSPYSVHTCLSMVYVGARNSTAKEIKKTLAVPFSPTGISSIEAKLSKGLVSKQLQMANALWLDVDTYILSDFRHAIVDDFQANMQTLDFSKTEDALQTINDWTSNQTQGNITDLLQSSDIDENTRLVLTNAVYFKGDWQRGFDPTNTKMGDFFVTSDDSIRTKIMRQTGYFPYFEDALVQLLAMPFKGNNDLACLILLPKDPSGLITVEKAFSSATINSWISSLDTANVAIAMPSFCFKQRINLNDALVSLGMKESFGPQANFSGIF
jgi:serpin B